MNFQSNQKNSSIRHWPVMENRSKPTRFQNGEDHQAVEPQSVYQFISQRQKVRKEKRCLSEAFLPSPRLKCVVAPL